MDQATQTLIFYDVDGTLAEPFQSLPANLIKTVRSLDRAGIKQILCSGKNKDYLSGMARALGLEATSDIIAENGGVIFDWKKQKYRYLSDSSKPIARVKPKILELLNGVEYYEEPKDTIITLFIKDLALTQMFAEKISQQISNKDCAVKHYKDGAIDVLFGNCHKGVAVDYYLQKICPNHQAYTCGDGVNDLEMLSIGTPVTFAGAHEEVIKLVTKRQGYIAEKVGPDGLLQSISKLIFNNQLAQTINHVDFIYRDWGSWEVLTRGKDFKVKRMAVNPGQRLSLQKHLHRSEHWFVFEGTAGITLNDKEIELSHGQDFYIPVGDIHSVKNIGDNELIIIEVQRGEYLGEDDIIRFS